MTRIVMKFGGTSMAGIERIRSVAARVKREVDAGNEVAVVVSAMAGETDRLVTFCREANPLYDPAEYDVVVASGLPRTVETAEIVAPGHEIERWPDLSEWRGGRLDAIPQAELEQAFVGGQSVDDTVQGMSKGIAAATAS